MRICFYGGPNVGKSATAAFIYYKFLKKGYSIELVREFIKDWAYMGRKSQSGDQIYVYANQHHREDFLFQCGVKNIVTDSPLHLQCAYAKFANLPYWKELKSLASYFDSKHDSCSIFLDRGSINYNPVGRYETLEQAVAMDNYIKEFLDDCGVKYTCIDTTDENKIETFVGEYIDGNA